MAGGMFDSQRRAASCLSWIHFMNFCLILSIMVDIGRERNLSIQELNALTTLFMLWHPHLHCLLADSNLGFLLKRNYPPRSLGLMS
ncbi:hypothetical protein QYF36_016554 [Acer negundo]|nr:hypothetical protein QYF36_016554 [Acer negundo]